MRRRRTQGRTVKPYTMTEFDKSLIEKGGVVDGPEHDPRIVFDAEFDGGCMYEVQYRCVAGEFDSGGRQEDKAIAKLRKDLGI